MLDKNIDIYNQYKSKKFDDDYRKFESGKYSDNDNLTLLDKTPDFFYNLGYDTNKPIVINMNKLNKLTGYKSEKLFWKDVKNKFESAYNSDFVESGNINKKLKTKNNGLNKYKTEALNSEVMSKYARTKKKVMTLKDANNFYVVDNFNYGEYDIKQKISIEGNEEYVTEVERWYDNYVDQPRKNDNRNNGRIENRQGNSDGNIDYAERLDQWEEFLTRLSKKYESKGIEREEYISKSNGNSREVDNTSFL